MRMIYISISDPLEKCCTFLYMKQSLSPHIYYIDYIFLLVSAYFHILEI